MTTDVDILKLQVKVWEKTIDVQQHFNDIAMRVRNLFVTLLAAVLAILGYTIKESAAGIHTGTVDLSDLLGPYIPMIIVLGLFICAAFWFLDRLWYHRLLRGSVKMGSELEARLTLHLGDVGLTQHISEESRFFGRWRFDATLRLDIFYGLFALVVVVVGEVLKHASVGTYAITGAVAMLLLFVSYGAQRGRSEQLRPIGSAVTPGQN